MRQWRFTTEHQPWTREVKLSCQKEIAMRLRLVRMKLDCSQQKLAGAVGVTFQQVQKYENGLNGIRATMLLQLCDVLNCTYDDLLGPRSAAAPASVEAAPAPIRTDAELATAISIMNGIQTPSGRKAMVKMMHAVAAEFNRLTAASH
jgi:transcriptional regulator with XRE-family HTH domain